MIREGKPTYNIHWRSSLALFSEYRLTLIDAVSIHIKEPAARIMKRLPVTDEPLNPTEPMIPKAIICLHPF
jgi:hypothetical protein